jgi:hypothetical protein
VLGLATSTPPDGGGTKLALVIQAIQAGTDKNAIRKTLGKFVVGKTFPFVRRTTKVGKICRGESIQHSVVEIESGPF